MAENSYTDEFETRHVNVGRSAVRDLHAGNADIAQSAVQHLTAETVQAAGSAFGMTNASTIELKESTVGLAAGDYVRIEDSRVLVLLAPRVSGNVHAVITLPVAFAFGAGYFLIRRLILALFGRRGD